MAPITRSMDRPQQLPTNPSVVMTTQSSKLSKKTGNSSSKKVTTGTRKDKKDTPKKKTVGKVKKPAPKKSGKKGGKTGAKTKKSRVANKDLNPENEPEEGPGPEAEHSPYIPGSPTGNTQHGQIGFDRSELQDSGSLEFGGACVPTLSNDIHSIWDMGNFDLIPVGVIARTEKDAFYEAFKPALRLASLWITCPEYQSFWRTMLRGRIQVATGEEPTSILRAKTFGRKALMQEFLEIAGNSHFRFVPLIGQWAMTYTKGEITTDLHDDFYHLSASIFETATTSEQLRFLFFVAVNLVHELAHRVFQERWQTELPDEPLPPSEPVFQDIDVPHDELGVAWEQYMFGGRIQAINLTPTPGVPDGLVRLHLDMVKPPGDNAFKDPQRRIAPLSTEWISKLFSQTWWGDKAKKAEKAPGNPGLSPLRATVFYTTDDNVFRTDAYDTRADSGRDSRQVCGHY